MRARSGVEGGARSARGGARVAAADTGVAHTGLAGLILQVVNDQCCFADRLAAAVRIFRVDDLAGDDRARNRYGDIGPRDQGKIGTDGTIQDFPAAPDTGS